MIYIFVLFACLLFGFIEWKSIHLPLINFVLVMKWLKAMFLCMVVFAALTVVANDSFSQKKVRVCASTSLFSIANKEPAAFISFQEIIPPLTSFSAFGEKLLYLIASLTFFLALFTLSVALLFYERRVSYVRLKSVFWQERYSCYVLCRMLN